MGTAVFTLVFFGTVIWLLLVARFSRQAVWFLLLWIPIQGWVQLNVFNDSSATVLIYEFQILALYLIFGLRTLQSPNQFGPPSVLWFAAPFTLWALLLIPYSVSENGVLLTLVGLRTYLLPLPLIWIGYRAFETRRQLETVGSLLMLQLVLVGAIAASQFTALSTATGIIAEIPAGFSAAGVIRPPGTFSQSGHLGNYILFAIPFGVGLLGVIVPLWKRVCFVAGLAGATLALMANTQRSTMVFVVLILPAMVLIARRRQAVMKVAVAVCVITAGGIIGAQVAGEAARMRIASIVLDVSNTLFINPSERMADALLTPVWGAGLGIAAPGFRRLEQSAAMGTLETPRLWIKFGESFMPALVYDTGVPGLLLFYLFVVAIMYRSAQALRNCRRTDMGLLAAAIIAFLLAVVLYSWPYSPLRTPPIRVLFWFWAGVLLSLPRLVGNTAVLETAIVHRRSAIPVRRLMRPSVPLPSASTTGVTGPPRRRQA